jgi:uncharacterized protein YbaR (Trm112 family)
MSLDPALLAVLACPVTRGPLRYVPERDVLVSDAAGLVFPVRDGVPVLLVEDARPLDRQAAQQ